MCGLIAAFNTDPKKKNKTEKTGPVNEFIINQYEDQHGRGTQGFGIIRIDKNQKIEVDRATEPVKFLLDLYQSPSKMIIAHHRMPTSTENKMSQTHPMYVANELLTHSYLVVHNGVVGNAEELKTKHETLGFKYTTEHTEKYGGTYPGYPGRTEVKFNDSEALAIELALFIEGKIHTIGTFSNAAFIIVQIDKTVINASKIFYGRRGNPLMMSKTRGSLRLSSEGSGNEVEEGHLYSFDVKDADMKLTKKKLPFKEFVQTKTVPTTEGRKLFNEDGTIKTTTELATTTEVKTWPKETAEEVLSETTDEKYIAAQKTRFKEAVKNKGIYEIQELLDEHLEEQLDKASQILQMFKEACMDDTPQMPDDTTYMNQIEGHLKTMQALVGEAEAESFIAEEKEEEIKKDEDEYTKNWHQNHPAGYQGVRSFGSYSSHRHHSHDFEGY